MENPTQMDDLGGTIIFGNIHMFLVKLARDLKHDLQPQI